MKTVKWPHVPTEIATMNGDIRFSYSVTINPRKESLNINAG